MHTHMARMHTHTHTGVYRHQFMGCALFRNKRYLYCIALNYSLGIDFFPAIFNQTTKQDRRLLLEETCAVYNL